ncbi:uncharacterized protein [Nicotiana tomentosiformis]|uniref:uncharacterized protein n=1 Tax=Nicotiana tomentosiformis TaxID=4098 RepID=UPI00388CD10F
MSPPVYCDAKKKVFLKLRHGSMSIAKYQQKFLKLSRYAGGIIDGERDKCRRFEEGLNGYIRKSVAILQLDDFSKLILAALIWERIDKEEDSRRENRFMKGNLDYGGPSEKGKFDYSKNESAQKSSYHKKNKPNFSIYSKLCPSLDHKVKDYPNPNPNPLSYTHTEGSVQKHVTTHFQANRGARPRNVQAPGSGGANQASGSRSTARVNAMRLRNDQDGSDLVVDLLEMPFQDYDVIVGMDWIHRYHALVNCRLKQVTFRTPAYSRIVVQGEISLTSNIIYAVLVRKVICQGCHAYLAHLVDTRLESPSLKDIPIMCDFPDVFLDELPGLPPEREIGFPIELVPRTTPISIAPYRVAPADLKELNA